MEKPLVIIILGPPGSGKGTQARLLAQKFNLEYVGGGDALRARQEIEDFTGKKLKELMAKGELAPSFIIIKTLGDTLEKIKEKSNKEGLVLDGWTRIIFEAILTDEAIHWYDWDKNVKVILLNISNKTAYNRLTKRRQCKVCGRIIPWSGESKELQKCDQCGGPLVIRPDDNIEAIKTRLDEYKKQTSKTIKYYKKQGRLIEINGEKGIDDVFNDILKKIEA
jgi:adenylate kinase